MGSQHMRMFCKAPVALHLLERANDIHYLSGLEMHEQRMLANDAFQKKLISTSFGMRCRRKGLQSLYNR